jgi:hypothetical protein
MYSPSVTGLLQRTKMLEWISQVMPQALITASFYRSESRMYWHILYLSALAILLGANTYSWRI